MRCFGRLRGWKGIRILPNRLHRNLIACEGYYFTAPGFRNGVSVRTRVAKP